MTSKEINYSNGADLGDGVSGFYYDSQLNLETMSASLHPNSILDKDGIKWISIPDNEQESTDNQIYSDTRVTTETKERYPYREKPICKAIINEEFQVSIANTYTGFGEDFIGGLWSNLKPLAPYAGEAAKFLADIANQTENYFANKVGEGKNMSENGNKALSAFLNVMRDASNFAGQAGDYLNRSLVVQGSRFSYYNGTGIDFGNLVMKFTIFSGFHTVDEYDERDHKIIKKVIEYNSVYNQIAEILPYVIGEFVPITDITKNSSEEVKQFVSEFASWQMPPGGYVPYYKDVDTVHPGTLKLRLGPYFSVENLVIKSAQFTYSKAMSKNPTYKGDSKISKDTQNYLVPLSCEVLLNLGPITKHSRQSLERYIKGTSSRGTKKILEGKMADSLSKIEERTNDMSKISRI